MASSEMYPRRRTVPWRGLDTEALVVDPKAGLLYPLNCVAARIWELCDGTHTVDAILRTLMGEFDADEATIRDDLGRFVDDLVAAGLVTLESTASRAEDGRPARAGPA